MDKFGIFNLLSTLMNAKTSSDNPATDDFSANPARENTTSTKKETKKYAIPLQANMLNTMYSHDAIVKRVMNKNK